MCYHHNHCPNLIPNRNHSQNRNLIPNRNHSQNRNQPQPQLLQRIGTKEVVKCTSRMNYLRQVVNKMNGWQL